jgi:MFS family permease
MSKIPTDPRPRETGRLAAFGYRDFRLYWISLFISNAGTWMQMTAINWLLYELTHSPIQLGMNGIFRAVPVISFGLFSGALADRYDRKRILLCTQITSALLALGLAVLDHSGFIQAWHIYAFTFVSATVHSLDGPARQALFPSLIPRSVLPNAVALNSLLWKGAALLGPSLGGIAITLAGTSGAFYANSASFLCVVIALLLIRTLSPVPQKRGHLLRDVKEGFSHVLSQQIILGVMIMEAVSSVFGLDHAMLTIFASDILRVGAGGFGLLQSARGLGAVIGSGILIGMGQPSRQGRILAVSAIFYGIGFALFGLSHSFLLSLALLIFVGATDTVWGATRNTILQLKAPERLRGRIMGVFNLSSRGLHPLGQVETGLVVPLIGAREATFLGGLLVTTSVILTAWRIPGIRKFRWDERVMFSSEADVSEEERSAG